MTLRPRGDASSAPGNTQSALLNEVCGNTYDKIFEVRMAGVTHFFDSFECAIHALTPTCRHCGCRIVGHGIEAAGIFYCCANCSRQSGAPGARDRIA